MGEKPQSAPVARPRLDSVDKLRGLVMVIMALDHVRDFFGVIQFDALDLKQTDVPLYFTRWISHYCAPTFVFLTGVGAYLYGSRGRSTGQLSWYLLSRGAWLVVVEALILTPLWRRGEFFFDDKVYGPIYVVFGQVFWAIGASMVLMSLLVWLPRSALLLFALVIIAGHNAFDGIRPDRFGSYDWLWNVLHVQGRIPVVGPIHLNTAYPLVPWVGVMAAGFSFGAVLRMDTAARRTWILGLGSLFTIGFFVLRASNVYGDPLPWTVQYREPRETFTVLSFLNCHKYPPSLCYLLMTIGPALLLLAAFESSWGPLGRILTVYGRVPMFYYLLHLPLIVGLSVLTRWIMAGSGWQEEYQLPYRLPGVYAVWLVVITILFFPCWWYSGVKTRSKSAWLTYL